MAFAPWFDFAQMASRNFAYNPLLNLKRAPEVVMSRT
jgi:hypothetical protein